MGDAGDEVRVTLRLPSALRDRLSESASDSSRSMNGEIIARLEQSYIPDNWQEIALTLQHQLKAQEKIILNQEEINDLQEKRVKAMESAYKSTYLLAKIILQAVNDSVNGNDERLERLKEDIREGRIDISGIIKDSDPK